MTLPQGDAQRLGFDPRRWRRVPDLVRQAIDEGVFPGAAYVVCRRGLIAHRGAEGRLAGAGTRAVTPETCYDLASLTKPLSTALALLLLVEEGNVCLADTPSHHLGDAELPPEKPSDRDEEGIGRPATVTLAQLLTHTSGLPAWLPLYEPKGDPTPPLRRILSLPLGNRPSTVYVYSDLGYILLGAIIERVAGATLDRFFAERIAAPLELRATGYWRRVGSGRRWTGASAVSEGRLVERTAPTAHSTTRKGTLVAEVHDANADYLGGVAGHAGLFSTAEETAAIVEMVRQGGSLQGVRILSPAAAALTHRSLLPPSVGGHSAGWFTPPNPLHLGADLSTPSSFSHSGFTGTSILVDPERELSVVLLTNAVYAATGRHIRFRRLFHNAVQASLDCG